MLPQYYATFMYFKSTTEECFLLINSVAELLWFLVFILFAGGADKNVVVFDKTSEQILATLKGHTKKVTSVVFHPSQVRALDFLQSFSMRECLRKFSIHLLKESGLPGLHAVFQLLFALQELVFSASPDATIRIWSVSGASCVQVVRAHESAVTGLSLHATGDYLLSSSDDQVRVNAEYLLA